MTIRLQDLKGCPIDRQRFTWRELVQPPISKLDDDAFTRVRIILMNGLEMEALRFQHAAARMNGELRLALAKVRRIEHHQATSINWLIGADHSPLETTIAYEQVAIEVTAAVAQREPDPYLAQTYRFGLLEDFDHMYRYSAMLDRLEGKDANNILQCYTDILTGRPTIVEHRAPEDDLRLPFEAKTADPLSKLHALTIMSAEQQTHDYYMNIGPLFTDPVARLLYAEIASIEEQHVTQYESIIDPDQGWLEQWLMHELMEVYNYHGCATQETNPRIRALWERYLDYEVGQLQFVMGLFKDQLRRDPMELLPETLPEPIPFASQREFWMGFDAVRPIDDLESDLLLVPLPGHTVGHAGVAVRTDDRWKLLAGDAYFHEAEMHPEPYCTPGLRFYQWMMEKDRAERLRNQRRLRALRAHPEGPLEIFCSHDPAEFERLAGRSVDAPPYPV